MSYKIDTGGAAQDMTLRDWYAGEAMKGMMASVAVSLRALPDIVFFSFQFADAMIAERNKANA